MAQLDQSFGLSALQEGLPPIAEKITAIADPVESRHSSIDEMSPPATEVASGAALSFKDYVVKTTLCGIPVGLTYLAEGAANIIWCIDYRNEKPLFGPEGPSCILRTRKYLEGEMPVDTLQIYENILECERYLPKDSVLTPVCVHIEHSLPKALNKLLAWSESTNPPLRPLDRHRSRVIDDRNALILPNLIPSEGSGNLLFEFKPKWLLQSPTAPEGYRRCRTCAYDAKRGRTNDGKTFCPLVLVEGRREEVAEIVQRLCGRWKTHGGRDDVDEAQKEKVAPLLAEALTGPGKKILTALRKAQEQDSQGVLECDKLPRDDKERAAQMNKVAHAMTYRDCTMFVTVKEAQGSFTADIKLADLDLKEATEGRVKKWVEIERSLIDEGWYTGKEKDPGQVQHHGCSFWNT
ncbi:hypothetical protein EJ06DRAFT_532471 [Trichodelitschia bisporula]|uniref:Inositol-pentakisphosphate 2-kinase n=1 Tax=Trichodelitschia bisporula TaxID=703511 RepID=A0A6G1HQB0_9PEZI|nr:hypothetical protein EJ06DRAFT_532471 [Trichodelitschia bisporula]